MFSRGALTFRSAARCASTLVLAAHDGGALTAASLATISAAQQLSSGCTLLVTASAAAATEAATLSGVSRVLRSETERPSAAAVAQLIKDQGFTHILAPSCNEMKDWAPRIAAAMDVSPITDVLKIVDDKTFVRPMYAGNALATVTSGSTPALLTVRATAFEKAAASGSPPCPIEEVSLAAAPTAATFVSKSTAASLRPDLTAARVVISGGRGMKEGANFALLDALADKLGGAVGASRAAVDAGMVPNEYQVGQTGKVVAPDLYVAVGISGAIQHLSGMKDSKTIVAINKDADAPIFQVADYGLVTDLFDAVPKLTALV
ncbi:DHS-like NAD/FAD-binding domain-containing protein [Pelagophyceae sp. CCMP2097]|nr:DHS-like NAD/FAD-binding domain-containing protein [Pelagophyceae sp. CCMP2097]|mmetsp:Transcript_3562/g.10813  ORF Transcript_3562/g.10813 Transcript_3562/m.10813 type:complete len:319 (-) Transcript_3562:98-1054(-)